MKNFSRLLAPFLCAATVALTGCISTNRGVIQNGYQAERDPAARLTAKEQSLKKHLVALGAGVDDDEARRVAICAYRYPRELAREYHVVWPPLFHNFLVNIGLRKRGLCYQWAEDLLARLRTAPLDSLELHWGIARADTPREHNCLVITARGRPFEEGIVLDAWRRGGNLVWSPVATDHYPWVEGELDALPPSPTSLVRAK